MSSSPMSTPLGFYSLSEADQKLKLRKKRQIEQHWGCSIDQVLPPAIRPRVSRGKSSKAKIGHQTTEAEWWRWSVDLFYKLENLAAMTSERLPFAQALMQAEVSQRQQDFTCNSRETAEILKSDVIKIISELRERDPSGGYNSDDDEDDYEDGDGAEYGALDGTTKRDEAGEDADDVEEAGNVTAALNETNNANRKDATENIDRPVKIKTESDDEPSTKRKLADGNIPAAKRRSINSASRPSASKPGLEMRANIASMRAAAARLREQAAQREAKAYKLEAEMFEKEAGEVD